MVSHSFSDRYHSSASFGVSLFNEFAAGRNARRTAESVLLVSSQSIIGKGTLAAGGFLVTSFRAKSRNLPCPAVIHVSVKMKIDVFVFRFPAVSRRPFMGLPERSLGCARDDETGSGWFLTGFSRRFTPKNPVRLHNPFGELPRWGAKNVLPLNIIALPRGEGCDTASL